MAIVDTPADGPIPQAAQGVSVRMEPAGRVGGVLRVQQVALLDGEEEDEPID